MTRPDTSVDCCGSCRFWQGWPKEKDKESGEADGICRRFPPTIIFLPPVPEKNFAGSIATRHPFTRWDTWCGEFEGIGKTDDGIG